MFHRGCLYAVYRCFSRPSLLIQAGSGVWVDMLVMECPAKGCEYSGALRSVAAHYSGKRDDLHGGGYYSAVTMLEEQIE